MPVIPATQEAEAGDCGEPRLRHCTPAWVTRAKLRLKKIKIEIKKERERERERRKERKKEKERK